MKPGLENFEHYFASMWNECNCAVVWTFFGIALLGIRMKTDLCQSCDHCWVFQICWHIECSTSKASKKKKDLCQHATALWTVVVSAPTLQQATVNPPFTRDSQEMSARPSTLQSYTLASPSHQEVSTSLFILLYQRADRMKTTITGN